MLMTYYPFVPCIRFSPDSLSFPAKRCKHWTLVSASSQLQLAMTCCLLHVSPVEIVEQVRERERRSAEDKKDAFPADRDTNLSQMGVRTSSPF